MDAEVKDLCAAVQKELGTQPFDLAIVLGSGLGALADQIENSVIWDYKDFSCFPTSTVPGHAGRLVVGTFYGWRVLLFQGRHHLYEGHSAWSVSVNVRIAAALNCRRLLLTNAVGGINEAYRPGDFMFISDHINLMGDNPLRGIHRDPFVDLCSLYQGELFPPLKEFSLQEHVRLHRGILCAVPGPSYETPAEIRAFKIMGADAVSMSTVPEAIMAKYLSMEIVGLSLIANCAAGLSSTTLDHEDVLSVGKNAEGEFCLLVQYLVEQWQKKALSVDTLS